MSQTNEAIDIFISYKREEAALLKQVSAALTSVGYVVVSDDKIKQNDFYPEAIDKLIHDARLTLVLWTERSVSSPWVCKEARRAVSLFREDKKRYRFLGVLVEATKLPIDFADEQQLDISDRALDPHGLAAIVAQVQSEIGIPSDHKKKAAPAQSQQIHDEYQLYTMAEQLGSLESYEGYIKAYPNGRFREKAEAHIAVLKKKHFRLARRMTSVGALSLIVAFFGLPPLYYNIFRNETPQVPQASDGREISALNIQISDLQKDYETQRDALDAQLEEITTLSTEIEQKEAELALRNDQIRQLGQSYDTSVELRNTLTNENKALSEQIRQISLERDTISDQRKTALTEAEQSKADIQRLQAQLVALQAEQASWQQQLSNTTTALTTAKAQNSDLAQTLSNTQENLTRHTKVSDEKVTVLQSFIGSNNTMKLKTLQERITKHAAGRTGTLIKDISLRNLTENYIDKTDCTNIQSVKGSYESISELMGVRMWIMETVLPWNAPTEIDYTKVVYGGMSAWSTATDFLMSLKGFLRPRQRRSQRLSGQA